MGSLEAQYWTSKSLLDVHVSGKGTTEPYISTSFARVHLQYTDRRPLLQPTSEIMSSETSTVQRRM